jgi:hypothetical protein
MMFRTLNAKTIFLFFTSRGEGRKHVEKNLIRFLVAGVDRHRCFVYLHDGQRKGMYLQNWGHMRFLVRQRQGSVKRGQTWQYPKQVYEFYDQ